MASLFDCGQGEVAIAPVIGKTSETVSTSSATNMNCVGVLMGFNGSNHS
jgi:hypothetical protein